MLSYSCPIYTFFSQLCPCRTPGRILTVYGLNVALSPKDVLLGVSMTTRNLRGSTPPPKKNQNGAWLGIFQPNWQHHKFAISPTAKIGSTPNFDRIIEPHSWLREWSRIAKFQFKMADGCHIPKCWTAITRLQLDRFGRNLGSGISSCPDMSAIMRLPWQRPLSSNGALNIQQLWASGGRTHEPILMQFGTVCNSKFRLQWQSRDQILNFFKFKMADGRC